MKNLWGKLSRTGSLNVNLANSHVYQQQSQIKEEKPISIDYYRLKQFAEQMKQAQNVNLLQYPQSHIVDVFSQVMQSLHGLLNVVQELRSEAEKNTEKLIQYERIKSVVAQHSEIVNSLQQQASQNMNRLYEEKRNLSKQYLAKIQSLQMAIKLKQQQIANISNSLNIKNQQARMLKQELSIKNTEIQRLNSAYNVVCKRINQFTKIQDSSIQLEVKGYNPGDNVQLQTILIYSKLRKLIYSFISPVDFRNLQLSNKQIHYICNRTLKKQFIAIMLRNKDSQIYKMNKAVKQYEKIFDAFPAQNIRTNAIKYLYFKIKPGGYILPFLQQEGQQHEKLQEKSKISQISNFFRKKNEAQGKQRVLTYQSLKNDSDFKQIQKKIQVFFGKLFGIQSADDLKIFNQTMKRQLNQLKNQLKNSDKSMQLLCMSKLLYLQINELNNLLQVCFALLINEHSQATVLTKKNDDLKQNDKVLRNLVQSIANDRQQIQKRIFYLQNQNLRNKTLKEAMEIQIKSLKQTQTTNRQIIENLQKQIKNMYSIIQQNEVQRKENEDKLLQVMSILKQIPIREISQG